MSLNIVSNFLKYLLFCRWCYYTFSWVTKWNRRRSSSM